MAFKRVTGDGQLLPLKMVKMLTLINEPLGDLNAWEGVKKWLDWDPML